MASVLIVDDSEVDRRLAGGLLTKSGRFEVQYANSGSEALASLHRSRPSIVVTDLHMPDRGGLMLVEACRLHYENLPVVLMTGQGSENLAVEALKAGAAGYVPKEALADRLIDTIDDILSHVREDEAVRRLISRLVDSEFVFELDNDPDLVTALVEMTQQMLDGLGICNTVDCMRVGVALREVALIAMICGNLDLPPQALSGGDDPTLEEVQLIANRRTQSPYSERRLGVELHFSPREARLTLRHQGQPLWNQRMLNPLLDEQLDDPSMRAAVLMQSFCDAAEIHPDGMEVTLVKRGADTT
jgi:CheY-like chemotaxis protein